MLHGSLLAALPEHISFLIPGHRLVLEQALTPKLKAACAQLAVLSSALVERESLTHWDGRQSSS